MLKRLETELNVDWQKIQVEEEPAAKAKALEAYYVKYEKFRKARAWLARLSAEII